MTPICNYLQNEEGNALLDYFEQPSFIYFVN
jgi:hypothetical protein